MNDHAVPRPVNKPCLKLLSIDHTIAQFRYDTFCDNICTTASCTRGGMVVYRLQYRRSGVVPIACRCAKMDKAVKTYRSGVTRKICAI